MRYRPMMTWFSAGPTWAFPLESTWRSLTVDDLPESQGERVEPDWSRHMLFSDGVPKEMLCELP